jgi:hypothetical protein
MRWQSTHVNPQVPVGDPHHGDPPVALLEVTEDRDSPFFTAPGLLSGRRADTLCGFTCVDCHRIETLGVYRPV